MNDVKSYPITRRDIRKAAIAALREARESGKPCLTLTPGQRAYIHAGGPSAPPKEKW